MAACAPGMGAPNANPGPTNAGGAQEACQMQGAAAEDRYAGPLGNLSIDSALVRARVTQDCLDGRPGPAVIGRPGLR